MGYRIASFSFAFCVLLVSQCCTHSNGSTEINKEMYDLLQQTAIDENNGGHKLFKLEKCDSLVCAVCSGDPAGKARKWMRVWIWYVGDSPLGSLRLEYAFNDKKAKRFLFGVGHQN